VQSDSATALSHGLPESLALSESAVIASQAYVGRWNRLISTTNWEKGRIIAQWRDSLIDEKLPAEQYSDEAWSRLVGGVSGQHVGRLRRTFQRFGHVQDQYDGLYWSHFQAALDWEDAEMWLEGARANGWSIANMRAMRSEALGKLNADPPPTEEIVSSELDEDFEPVGDSVAAADAITGRYEEVAGDWDESDNLAERSISREDDLADDVMESASAVRPFENLPALPDDLSEAFESLKLAILRHKADEWREISADDVLRTLDSLKALVTSSQ
jgi:hypothetical protein